MTTENKKHFLDIESLDVGQLNALLDLAATIAASPGDFAQCLKGHLQINLFYEVSTRTRVSFEVAAKRLGMDVVNISEQGSSASKGEDLLDTFYTLQAMNPDCVVVRHPSDGAAAELARHATTARIINAGDGCRAHPTQALLDTLTLKQQIGDLNGLRLLIAGDIRHSRVARSNIALWQKLGVEELRLCGPESLLPGKDEFPGLALYQNLDEALEGVDVVMMLRIQHERIHGLELPDEAAYHRQWGLTTERVQGRDLLVMHPGPMNRGVEIASEVADGSSSLIRRQVSNGVYARMAVLHSLIAE